MLSILIPTYNYNCYSLVEELKNQGDQLNIEYEIIVQDDFSTLYLDENSKINLLDKCRFVVNSENLGRAKNRNKLVEIAKFPNLLFLDSDTFPTHSNFISNYLKEIQNNYSVVYGGICYQTEPPKKELMLRWKYGREREAIPLNKRLSNQYSSALFSNLLIKKELFLTIKFNEKIILYGYEDFLFIHELKQKSILINQIENEVLHLNLENSSLYLKKVRESIENLSNLNKIYSTSFSESKIISTYNFLKKTRLLVVIQFLFKITEQIINKNLLSNNPNLSLLDFFKLGYFCKINIK